MSVLAPIAPSNNNNNNRHLASTQFNTSDLKSMFSTRNFKTNETDSILQGKFGCTCKNLLLVDDNSYNLHTLSTVLGTLKEKFPKA